MYRSCIFCSTDLGANEALESFPVGRSLAFDGWKGRLWALCGRCGRWNLAPIEERWEAVESAEKQFRDARLRVHSENIGLAKLPDGTRLVRVGEALPGEMAAWRYGTQLVSRRRRHLVQVGVAGAVVLAATGGLYAAGALAGIGGLMNFGRLAWEHSRSRKVVYRLRAEDSPTGGEIRLRRYQIAGARVVAGEEGPGLRLPLVPSPGDAEGEPGRPLILTGASAQAVLSRSMLEANRRGASRRTLDEAIAILSESGGPEAYLASTAEVGATLPIERLTFLGDRLQLPGLRESWRTFRGSFRGEVVPYQKLSAGEVQQFGGLSSLEREAAKELYKGELPNVLPPPRSLALEMALHEESERHALEGELAGLRAAWREAEEIAAIADVLPDDPLELARR